MTSVGIIGLGSIGMRHFNNFKQLGCLVNGYDPGASTDEGSSEGWERAIHSDGAVIASPTSLHYGHISNIERPMLVEKPICQTREELHDLNTGHVKMVGYNLRFHSCVRKARDWLGQGLIGKPIWSRFICAQFNDKPAYLRDGVILNWSHEIDLAIHLLGQPQFVTSTFIHSSFRGGESMADIILNHTSSGCITTIHLDYLTKPERRGFTIVGTDGSIDVDLVGRQAHLKNLDGRIIYAFFGKDSFDENYLQEAQTFLGILTGKATFTGYCTAAQAKEVVNICLLAKENAK